MPFSTLFIILAAAGIIPIWLASFVGLELHAALAYNFLLLLIWLADLVITPGKGSFEASRVCEEKLSLGAENTVVLKIRNNSSRKLRSRLKDTIPPHFTARGGEVCLTLYPHAECEAHYTVIPQKRGEFTLGSIFMKYTGVIGLCTRTVRYGLDAQVKVYPNLKDLRRFTLAAMEKTRLLAGMKKTRLYGIGTEFESLREYAVGDDYRKINWMATARSNRLIVNNFESEKNQQVFILMDSSRVMNSEINGVKKLDYSINAAFLLADVATRKGDRAGLLVFDSTVRRFVRSGKGQGQFRLIASSLYNVEQELVTADYRGALNYLNERQKRRSLLCIFTELFNADEAFELVKTLKVLAARHVPLVITIKDERLEQAAAQPVADTAGAYLKGAAVKLIKERENVKRIFADSGIASLDVPPDRLSIEVINKYLTMKATLRL